MEQTKNERETITTSWGLIVRDHNSLLLNIEGVGQIEIFGWPTFEQKDSKIIICGTEFERPVKVVECELKT